MSDAIKIKKQLELFNLKAEKLNSLSFAKIVQKTDTGLSISGKRGDDGLFTVTSERRGPDAESIDAFVLTLRMFLQNNDQCSIGNLQSCYSSILLPEDIREEFRDIRKTLNEYLDDTHEIRLEEKGKFLTRREMIDTMLYGDLAHANDNNYRASFLAWTAIPHSTDMLVNEFIVIASRVLIAINWLKDLNERALATLA
ncbi:MAG: hypothetical protein IPL32_05060 [Chloracidobacterium sp.]|nr:hypothetical protein [Chloracidobacterium sp.]